MTKQHLLAALLAWIDQAHEGFERIFEVYDRYSINTFHFISERLREDYREELDSLNVDVVVKCINEVYSVELRDRKVVE